MKKNLAQTVVVHVADNIDIHAMTDQVNEFHVDVIERKLNQSNLTTKHKIAVIDKILVTLKL